MRSPFYFIIRPIDGKRYANTKDLGGGFELIVSSSQEDHRHSNRLGAVVALPAGYTGPVEVGATVLVHHNTFKYYYDTKGRQRSGRTWLWDDLFFIDDLQFFMYDNGDGWQAFGKYCFVRPARKKEAFIQAIGDNEPLCGELVYGNDELNELEVYPGAEVSYQPQIEYPFEINGETLYRLFTNNITMVL